MTAVAIVGVPERFASGYPRWVEGGRRADRDRHGQDSLRCSMHTECLGVNHFLTDGMPTTPRLSGFV